jgi:hypothetical protein
MKIEFELLPPAAPINFIRVKMNSHPTNDLNPAMIDVADLNEEQAKAYAEVVKQQFLDNWKKRKKKS